MSVIALVIAGCSAGEASESDRLEGAVRELAEAGAPHRFPTSSVDTVVCELIVTPSYECSVSYGDGAVHPFCAELRDGTVYMSSTPEGCAASSRGQLYQRATSDDFG